MATETIKQPYEFLARWKAGQFAGAHVIFEEVTLIDGVEIVRKQGEALTPQAAADLDFPFPDVLAQLQTDALVENDQLKARVAELEKDKAAQAEAHAAELAASQANTQALLAQVEALKAQAAEAEALLTEAQAKEGTLGNFFSAFKALFTK